VERKCRYIPLSKQPLVLVLGQVRFSPVRRMEAYLARIQEEFRRYGFPLEQAGKFQQLVFGAGGAAPVQMMEEQRWEYRTKDETWSVLLTQSSVVLQTTAYGRFEAFADKLLHVVRTVFAATEHDKLGVVERVGLRYVDVVQPREGEDFRFYLRPGFHGVADTVFRPRTHRLHVESRGKTSVGEVEGTMVVRVVQNDRGFALPPDLIAAAPKHAARARPGELITLVDMDHYIEGKFDPAVEWVVARAYDMHDDLIETFHQHVVTEDAIEVWK
jgi:uncharacterized protein (TIGR04255 family)